VPASSLSCNSASSNQGHFVSSRFFAIIRFSLSASILAFLYELELELLDDSDELLLELESDELELDEKLLDDELELELDADDELDD